MTKYAISREGAESLRVLSKNILTAAEEVVESCETIRSSLNLLGNRLGIFEDPILEIATKSTSTLLERKDYLYYLSDVALRTADDIEEMMALAASSTGRVASIDNSVTQNQLLGTRLIVEGYCDKVDFGLLDNQSAIDMATAVIEAKDQFSELDLQFIGSTQARNEHIENDLKGMYMSAYKQLNPGVPEEDLLPYIESRFESEGRAFLNSLQPSDDVIAQSLSIDQGANESLEECLISGYTGITVNESFASSYETFLATRKRDVAEGWKPQNCESPKATMDHELGHQIAKLTKAHEDPIIISLFDRFSTLDDNRKSDVLSGYAGTNIHEFIAESWSEYKNNPHCRDCAKEVSQRIVDIYNSKAYQKVYRR